MQQFNQLWAAGSKDDKKNLKLKVEFLYPEIVGSTSPKSHVEPLRSASENVDTIRNRIAKESITNVQVEHNAEIPPENMLSELKSLRNKYDGVVAYTVRLTAERDVMVQKLEGTEKEIANLRKKSNNSDGSSVGEASKADRIMEKQTNMKVGNSSFDSHVSVIKLP